MVEIKSVVEVGPAYISKLNIGHVICSLCKGLVMCLMRLHQITGSIVLSGIKAKKLSK